MVNNNGRFPLRPVIVYLDQERAAPPTGGLADGWFGHRQTAEVRRVRRGVRRVRRVRRGEEGEEG